MLIVAKKMLSSHNCKISWKLIILLVNLQKKYQEKFNVKNIWHEKLKYWKRWKELKIEGQS